MRHAEQLQRVETAQDQLAAAHGKLAQIERELAQLVAQQTPMPTAATAATADGAAPPTTTLILNPAAKIFLEGYHRPETVVAALEADDHVRLLSEPVDHASLPLIAPLGAYDGGDRHVG